MRLGRLEARLQGPPGWNRLQTRQFHDITRPGI